MKLILWTLRDDGRDSMNIFDIAKTRFITISFTSNRSNLSADDTSADKNYRRTSSLGIFTRFDYCYHIFGINLTDRD